MFNVKQQYWNTLPTIIGKFLLKVFLKVLWKQPQQRAAKVVGL